MKIRVLSDLHLEGRHFTYKHRGEDVVVLAGDISSWAKFGMLRRDNLLRSIACPTVYVLGNHEFYGTRSTRRSTVESVRTKTREFPHVHVLDDAAVDIDGVRFIGSTLWTDFRLPHRIPQHAIMEAVPRAIADFQFLRADNGTELTAAEMARWSFASQQFLSEAIATSPRKTVVVTHFMPSAKSIAKRFEDAALNTYFCCPVDHLIRPPVRLWIHGHTHDACQYTVGDTRVVCNPRGYAGESSGYDADLIIEV